MKHKLKNGFTILVKDQQIGENLFVPSYHLYKDELYVAKIDKDFFDDNVVWFHLLGESEERAYCEPHQILKPSDTRAYDAFNEYQKDRVDIEWKSGWVTGHQYWKRMSFKPTEEEKSIIK